MAFAPDGRLFVTEQGGDLRIIKNGTLLDRPFLKVDVDSRDERGLIGLTFDPEFDQNGFIYVYYTTNSDPIHNRLSRFTANASNPDVAASGSEKVLLEFEDLGSLNQNGGALHFGSDGKLYVGVGDNNRGQDSQSLSTHMGKILRINPDGTAAADNPFFNVTGAKKEIWALGLRNTFTFAFSSTDEEKMYVNDVGKDSAEEISQVKRGANYGWPACEGPCPQPNSNFTEPIYSYDHPEGGSRAIAGGTFYETSQFPEEYRGSYFFGDFVASFIKRLTPDNQVVDFLNNTRTPVDIDVGPDGGLYYLSYLDGDVRKVSYGVGAQGGERADGTELPPPSNTTDDNADGSTTPTTATKPSAAQNAKSTVSAPVMRDANNENRILSTAQTGQAVVLSTKVVNNNSTSNTNNTGGGNKTEFLTLMEARSTRDGVTHYLKWHVDMLEPKGTAEVRLSWVPKLPGDYQLRTFAISDLENPQILTPLATSKATVVSNQ